VAITNQGDAAVKEPERKEEAALDEGVRQPHAIQTEVFSSEPKAYAFDGWGMVPLELDPV
jgi:hypothetical protein